MRLTYVSDDYYGDDEMDGDIGIVALYIDGIKVLDDHQLYPEDIFEELLKIKEPITEYRRVRVSCEDLATLDSENRAVYPNKEIDLPKGSMKIILP